jgi:hypothetical protein
MPAEATHAAATHPAAHEHLPAFIAAPGNTDVLMVVMAVVLVISVFMFGVLFFRLHTLPERIAHKTHKLQFEIVAVLGLISLFTHMHIFWIAGLLLALVEFPDFGGAMGRIADAIEKRNGILETAPAGGQDLNVGNTKPIEPAPTVASPAVTSIKRSDGSVAKRPELLPTTGG